MGIQLSNQDLALIYTSLWHRRDEFIAENHPKTDRCSELIDIFAGAQKSNHVAVLFASADTCAWSVDDDGIWQGDCGIIWVFDDGTPTENEVNFCPMCGRRLAA